MQIDILDYKLLKLFLERGDPKEAISALSKKMKKILNNPFAQTRYKIRNITDDYPYRLLIWATYLGTYLLLNLRADMW